MSEIYYVHDREPNTLDGFGSNFPFHKMILDPLSFLDMFKDLSLTSIQKSDLERNIIIGADTLKSTGNLTIYIGTHKIHLRSVRENTKHRISVEGFEINHVMENTQHDLIKNMVLFGNGPIRELSLEERTYISNYIRENPLHLLPEKRFKLNFRGLDIVRFGNYVYIIKGDDEITADSRPLKIYTIGGEDASTHQINEFYRQYNLEN